MTQMPPRQEAPRDNILRYFLLGCLGVFLVGFLCMVIGGWYVYSHAKQIATKYGREFAVSVINESSLPADQKRGITAHVDRVMADYKAGKITEDQLGDILQQIAQSPVFVVGLVYAADEKYIKKSGLSAAEKVEATRTLQRLGRGAYEKKIPDASFKKIMHPMMKTDAQGHEQLKDVVTDDELRQTLASAKQEADERGVPDEAYTVNISEEIGKAIERVLHPPPATQPATPEASGAATEPEASTDDAKAQD